MTAVGGDMLEGAFVGWLVQVLGSIGARGARGAIRAIAGSADEATLRETLATVVGGVVAQVPEAARESLTSVLYERFNAPPNTSRVPDANLRAALRSAFVAQIEPLRDRTVTGTGTSYLEEIGVDADWLVHEVLETFIQNLRQVNATRGISELVSGLDAEELISEVRSLRDVIAATPALALDSLPRDIFHFINREGALARIAARQVAISSVFAVDGMPGVGKTALAVHAAHRLAPAFPDARLFLDLRAHSHGRAPVDPSAALETLLRALGLTADQIPGSLDGRVAVWRSQLAGKRALVVLDDAATGEQVRPLLPASRGCLAIVTSRRRLAGLEDVRTISLDVLDTDEAVELFACIIGPERASADANTVRKIVAWCAHLPLAIRLIGARLNHHPAWTVRDMLTDLATGQNRLDEIRAEGGNIMAVFERSYEGLNPEQKRLFRRLGLHPDEDFSAYAAAALNGTDVIQARRGLEELYDHHVVDEPRFQRYLLHDLLHDYARGRVEDEERPVERAQSIERLVDYYTFVASRADQLINLLGHRDAYIEWTPASAPELISHTQAIEWMESERVNLHACVQLALEQGGQRRATVLARMMAYFLRLKGYWSDALSLCQDASGLCEDIGDRAGTADMQFYCGDILRLTGRHPEALHQYEGALTIYQALSDRHREARTLHSIGDIERAAVRHAAALRRYEAALVIYRELANPLAESRALHSIADTHRLAGQYDEALSRYQHILTAYQDLDDRVGEARVLHSIGDLDRLVGRYDRALEACQGALLAYEELGDGLGEADALNSIGEIYQAMHRYTEAHQHYDDALGRYRLLGDRRSEARTLHNLGALYNFAGQREEARNSYENAATISLELGDPYLEASARCGFGHMLILTGHADQGLGQLRQALTVLEPIESLEADRIRTEINAVGEFDQ